jgi:hypothetical protein
MALVFHKMLILRGYQLSIPINPTDIMSLLPNAQYLKVGPILPSVIFLIKPTIVIIL